MGKTTVDMLKSFGGQVEAQAGQEVREQVMAGSEGISAKTSAEEIALWMKEAVKRLQALAGEHTAAEIMESCGENCALINRSVIDRARARRLRYESKEAFLSAEQRKPQAGTRLEREGDILYQIYTPQAFTRPMRCFCGLLRGLPEGVQVPTVYCGCSQAFVRTFWEGALGRPVNVELLESAVTGSTQCKFKIVPLT